MEKAIYKTMVSSMLTASFLMLFFLSAQAQVRGTVSDASTGDPLIGTAVFVKGTTIGTVTDVDGEYTINASPDAILVFSYVGYTTTEEAVGNRSVIDVALSQGELLEEVVVTGYTTQAKRNISGAVSVVETEGLARQPNASAIQSLQGRASGLHIVNNGRPGGESSIRIRGISTINNNEPLFIIDGAPAGEATVRDINPNDIESIQVLKDASASSIYGVRAANGVVIITTKKGTVTGDSRINLDVYYGVQTPGDGPDFLTPQQLADATWEFQRNAGQTPSHAQYGSGPNPVLPTYIIPVGANSADESLYNYETNGIARGNPAGTDWYDEVFSSAPVMNLNLTATGGSEQGQYALTAGVFRQDGIVDHTGYDRYSLRANSLYRALDGKLRFGENLHVSYTEEQSGGTGGANSQTPDGVLAMVYRMPSFIPVYDVGGNFAGTRASGFNNPSNPVALLERRKDNVGQFIRLLGTAYLEYDIVEGLTLKSSLSANIGSTIENKNFALAELETSEPTFNSSLNQASDHSRVLTWYNTAHFRTTLAESHNLNILVGTEAIDEVFTGLGGFRVGYFSDNLAFRHLSTGDGGQSNYGYRSESTIFSLFGKVDYDFNGKYILSATIRRDGSSRFADGNRWGTFPAFSAAWRISDEAFMDDAALFDDLKLRVGWGQAGNQNIPLYTYLDLFGPSLTTAGYTITGANNNVITGIHTTQFGNPDVTWETTTQLNIGFDATILDNRLDISFDWYDRDTEDMLLGVPRPTLSGIAGDPQVNIGTMNNTGIDLALGYSDVINDDFSFDVGFTFSMYDNEVVALANPDQVLESGNFRDQYFASRTAEGQPIGAFFGYDILGIFQTQAEADAHATQPVNAPGRFKYRDVNEDGVIDADDRTFLGSPHPDFTYGLNTALNFKNFDFGVFLQGTQGNEVWNGNRLFTDFFGYFTNSQKGAIVLNAYGFNGVTENALVPQLNANAPAIERESSSHYLEDGSYMRVKTLTLGYTLDENTMDRLGFSRLRFYVQGNNLFTISDYSGLDPEIGLDADGGGEDLDLGVDRGNYPVVKSITFGLSASF